MNLGQYLADILLQESSPEATTSPYHDLIISEMGEINRTAQEFNMPADDIQYAFEVGHEVILTDDIWSKLENTDSYEIKSLDQAVELANKYKKSWKPIVQAIKDEKQLPLPMVMSYGENNYYLVGGNTRLMIYKALGVQPVVLMATLNLKQMSGTITGVNEDTEAPLQKLTEDQTNIIREFIQYAANTLELQKLPSNLTFSYNTKEAQQRHTFGYFDPQNGKIWLYVKNRNMADILRTLAHELVHRRQDEQGRIDYNSGDTGSEIENEANSTAGVLLRNFGKVHENIYEGLKKNLINELDFNLNKAYDWKFEGGVDNKYTFTTGQTEYEVLFFPVGVSSKGVFERLYRPISEDNMVGTIPLNATNEFKVLEINATVMNITIDFLNKNKQWKDVMISPIEKRRYSIVKGFLDKHLPLKYFKDEEEGIFHIYRKIK